jgi:hydroxypyruvate isomerase
MYREIPFYERFAAAGKDGFEFAEFWSWQDKDLARVKEAADAAGVGIRAFNGDADYSPINPEHKTPYLDFLKRSMDAAKQVGAPSLTVHSNALDATGAVVNPHEELSYTVKLCSLFNIMDESAKLAEAEGIVLNLEPLNVISDHAGNFLKYTSDAAEIARIIGSPKLKVLCDIYHMQLNEGNLCNTIGQCADQIGHIHAADAPGRHEPGTGEINFARVFAHLEEMGYDGVIGFELFPKTDTRTAAAAIMSY